jgi:hypothetical protein
MTHGQQNIKTALYHDHKRHCYIAALLFYCRDNPTEVLCADFVVPIRYNLLLNIDHEIGYDL